jgi:hypothetical protein
MLWTLWTSKHKCWWLSRYVYRNSLQSRYKKTAVKCITGDILSGCIFRISTCDVPDSIISIRDDKKISLKQHVLTMPVKFSKKKLAWSIISVLRVNIHWKHGNPDSQLLVTCLILVNYVSIRIQYLYLHYNEQYLYGCWKGLDIKFRNGYWLKSG